MDEGTYILATVDEPSNETRLILKRVTNQEETPSLDNILTLSNQFEDILRVTTNLEESNGVEADVSNIETSITASPTPTLKIHRDHPKSQIISPVDTLIQTRNKSKEVFDALQDPSWVEAVQEELLQFKIQKVWSLVDCPKGEERIDYDEVFAPVTRIEAIRLFLAYASFMGFTVYQMDVKSAFLYGTIDEEVYVMQPPGFQDPESSNTPMDKENPWGKDGTGKDVDLHLYRSMIGSLMYLTASRPDIMFTICACARHQMTPKECHLHATIIATSTTEAEYVAAASCCGQVLWIQTQLLDYGHHFIRDCFEKKLINVDHIHTDENVADLLTKPFDAGRFQLSMSYETLSKEISTSILRLLQFCDYHNMVTILEKSKHNADFHPIVDFVEASPLRYDLTFKPTIYVSHIRHFWSTARIETTEEGTQILATVDGVLRTVTESYLRRNLKLQDEEGISSLPDTELFENLTLMGYNISPNQKFTFQKGFNEFSSNIDTALVCLATNRTYKFSKMIFDGLVKNGKGLGTRTEPHHTPSQEAQPLSPTHIPSPSIPTVTSVPTIPIPTVIPTKSTPLRQYTRKARIAQSSALPPVADEPASLVRDDSQGEACPTDSGFIADQDRVTIAKSLTLPHDSAPRVTSHAAEEGTQEVEINMLKERVKILEDTQGVIGPRSKDDAPIKGRMIDEEEVAPKRLSSDTEEVRLDEGEVAAKRTSEDTEEMANVLTTIDAVTFLASGAAEVPTGSGSIPTAGAEVPTGSDVVSTASLIFATATVVTPYRRIKGKEVMVESETPKKQKVQEQIDAQSQYRNSWTKKQKRDYYMAVIKNNLSWKVKDFKGMTFEDVEAKFSSVCKQIEDFIPMGSKEEAERIKRKGINLEQESAKKQKSSEEITEEAKEDLNQLWTLVKQTLSSRPPTSDKEMELWVELSRLYEPDEDDQLWTHTQTLMHAPVEWKLYDSCGVHHVAAKDNEIFMLVEKDYPLRKGLALVMISYKLQVENYSQMAEEFIRKI
nr:hypothetical protein [Tanacetum cinerariifolium]